MALDSGEIGQVGRGGAVKWSKRSTKRSNMGTSFVEGKDLQDQGLRVSRNHDMSDIDDQEAAPCLGRNGRVLGRVYVLSAVLVLQDLSEYCENLSLEY